MKKILIAAALLILPALAGSQTLTPSPSQLRTPIAHVVWIPEIALDDPSLQPALEPALATWAATLSADGRQVTIVSLGTERNLTDPVKPTIHLLNRETGQRVDFDPVIPTIGNPL